jgi:hypothetical protein
MSHCTVVSRFASGAGVGAAPGVGAGAAEDLLAAGLSLDDPGEHGARLKALEAKAAEDRARADAAEARAEVAEQRAEATEKHAAKLSHVMHSQAVVLNALACAVRDTLTAQPGESDTHLSLHGATATDSLRDAFAAAFVPAYIQASSTAREEAQKDGLTLLVPPHEDAFLQSASPQTASIARDMLATFGGHYDWIVYSLSEAYAQDMAADSAQDGDMEAMSDDALGDSVECERKVAQPLPAPARTQDEEVTMDF